MSYLFEFSHLILILLLLPIYTIFSCLCNNRQRQQVHLQRRQALRDRQRLAALSGRSVRSVIETEVESETTQCPRMTCVRMAPRLKKRRDVYERIDEVERVFDKMDDRMVVIVDDNKPKPQKKNVGWYKDLGSNDSNPSSNESSNLTSSH